VPRKSLSWPSPLRGAASRDLAPGVALDIQSQPWLNPALQRPSKCPTLWVPISTVRDSIGYGYTTKEPCIVVMTLSRWLPITMLLLSSLVGSPAAWASDEPPEEPRFRWVGEVERIFPREFPDRLSGLTHWLETGPVAASPTGLRVDFAHYPSSAEVVSFVGELEGLYPDLVDTYEVGQSWQGRPIMGLRLGNEATGDPEARPALYLDGQHHAREAISQQIVLYTIWYLLSNYGSDPLVTHLLNTRTVYAVPSVNVDGNDIWLADDFLQRRTANPESSDDDLDNLLDEDPANAMGYGTYLVYRYDFDQEWADSHPDDPFAPGWQGHYLGSEYLGVFDEEGNEIPQLDEDDDGSTNEDPIGGVDANRNYGALWELGDANPASPLYRGPAVWSEPESVAVRDFVLGRPRIVTALSYHSGADLILHPWAWSGDEALPDALLYELLSRKGSQLTEGNGFLGSPHAWSARALYAAPGTTMDWLYAQGICAWTPEAYGASSIVFAERVDASGSFRVAVSVGVGFNPDPSDILQTAERWNRFTMYVLAATPHLGLTAVAADEGLLTLTVGNDGFIPVEVTVSATGAGGGVATETLPYLQAGERQVSVPYPGQPGLQSLSVRLAARSLAGTTNKEVEGQEVMLWIVVRPGPDTVWVAQGLVEEFTDLGSFFGPGGWLAPRVWDTPDVYHLGPPLVHEVFLPLSHSRS